MYNLYIGANNKTGKVDRQKIRDLAGKSFEGFTIIDALGYWKGTPENSIILQIETLDRDQIMQLAELLKAELNQQAIGLQELPGLKFV